MDKGKNKKAKEKPKNSPTPQDKKLLARDMFLKGKHSQQEIAEILGISDSTVSKWAVRENWKALAEAERTAPKKISNDIADIVANLLAIIKEEGRIPTPQEADIICKFTNTRQKIDHHYDLTVFAGVCQDLTHYIAEHASSEEWTNEFYELLREYLQKKATEL